MLVKALLTNNFISLIRHSLHRRSAQSAACAQRAQLYEQPPVLPAPRPISLPLLNQQQAHPPKRRKPRPRHRLTKSQTPHPEHTPSTNSLPPRHIESRLIVFNTSKTVSYQRSFLHQIGFLPASQFQKEGVPPLQGPPDYPPTRAMRLAARAWAILRATTHGMRRPPSACCVSSAVFIGKQSPEFGHCYTLNGFVVAAWAFEPLHLHNVILAPDCSGQMNHIRFKVGLTALDTSWHF